MNLIRTVAPAIEPLTVDEVVSHLRLDDTNFEPTPAAPTVALAGVGAGNVTNGIHRYRVTFVTADGETDGGAISDQVNVANNAVNGRVALSNIPVGGGFVTARKIYRTQAGLNNYLFLATLNDNSTTIYEDNTADAGLGAGVPSTNTTKDPTLRSLIKSAREAAEEYLNKALITQTWKLVLDCFPDDDFILLKKPPLLTVTSVKYLDDTGALVTWDAANYVVDTDHFPGRLFRAYGIYWPIPQERRNNIEIVFTAGYGPTAASIPELHKHGMKLLITDLYQNREVNLLESITENPALQRCFADRYREFK